MVLGGKKSKNSLQGRKKAVAEGSQPEHVDSDEVVSVGKGANNTDVKAKQEEQTCPEYQSYSDGFVNKCFAGRHISITAIALDKVPSYAVFSKYAEVDFDVEPVVDVKYKTSFASKSSSLRVF